MVQVCLTGLSLEARLTGAGETAWELSAGSVVKAGLGVALRDVVLTEVALVASRTGAVEVRDVVGAEGSVVAGRGGAEALSNTASAGVP